MENENVNVSEKRCKCGCVKNAVLIIAIILSIISIALSTIAICKSSGMGNRRRYKNDYQVTGGNCNNNNFGCDMRGCCRNFNRNRRKSNSGYFSNSYKNNWDTNFFGNSNNAPRINNRRYENNKSNENRGYFSNKFNNFDNNNQRNVNRNNNQKIPRNNMNDGSTTDKGPVTAKENKGPQ